MIDTKTGKIESDKIESDKIELMNDFIAKMNNITEDFCTRHGRKPKASIITHGCQMNARDSETLAGMLELMGYEKTIDSEKSDLIIFNTCCVRENAENKLYGNLGNMKAEKTGNPDFKIVLCGCMMQQDVVIQKLQANYKYIDLIFGTHNIYRFPELLYSHFETGSMIIDIWKQAEEIVEDLPAVRQFPYKASVNIMYGCDNYCTFCIVPYVRGRERSRMPQDIIDEAKALAADGVKELMLLGQNVDSYGKGLPVEAGASFANLLQAVSEVDGIERLRFMSSHPKDISGEVIAVMRDSQKICKHLHLPVQAGSTNILKRMNRGYSKEEYLALVERVRAAMPDIAITTDIMVGFPGESEEDFEETLDLVRKARFAGAFTFIYSVRQGTPAARMEQLPPDIVKARFNRLLEEVNGILLELSQQKEGKVLQVLVESIDEHGIMKGRADDNSLVHVPGELGLMGNILDVKITQARTFYLNGELV